MEKKQPLPFSKWYYNFITASASKKARDTIKIERANDAKRVERLIDSCEELLPEGEIVNGISTDSINALMTSGTCLLCQNAEEANPAECFAQTDIGHEPPDDNAYNSDNSDVSESADKKANAGVVLPLNIACCKKCKTRHRIVELLPSFTAIVIAGAGLICLSIRSIRQSLYGGSLFIPDVMRPFLLFAVIVAVAIAAGILLRKFLVEYFSKKTVFDVFNISDLHVLKSLGWVKLMKNNQGSEFVFSDTLPSYITDTPAAESIETSADIADKTDN